MQSTSTGNVKFVVFEVLNDLPIPIVFSFVVPPWNKNIENSIEATIWFAKKFMSHNGATLIFHAKDPKDYRDIKSYLKSYKLKVFVKRLVVNKIPKTNSKDLSKKVMSIFPLTNLHFLFHSLGCSINMNVFLYL